MRLNRVTSFNKTIFDETKHKTKREENDKRNIIRQKKQSMGK